MTASVRKHLEIRNALSVILTLAICFFYVALAAASQRSLEVIDLSSSSTAYEVGKAREALATGGAIIVMTDKTPDEFRSTFGYMPTRRRLHQRATHVYRVPLHPKASH